MFLYAISIRQHFFAYIFYFFIQRNSIKNYRIFFSSHSIFSVLFMLRARETEKVFMADTSIRTRASNSSQLFTLIVSSPPASSFLTESYKSFLQNEWKILSSTENEGKVSFHMEISWERVENRMWKVWLVCLWEFFIRNWKKRLSSVSCRWAFPALPTAHFIMALSRLLLCVLRWEGGRRKHENFHRFSLCYVRREVVHSASEDSLQMLTYSISWWARHSSKDQRTKDSRTLPVLMLSWNLNLPLFAQTTVHVAAVIGAWFMW